MQKKSAFMLAATHSGAGKTTITLGLLAALQKKGFSLQPFKCGPDFIDPTLHHFITGKISRNLDLRMCGSKFVTTCFEYFAEQSDISVVEGVMGLFDGGQASSAELAKKLGIPVILIVDAKGCAESIAAVVKGFESLDPALRIAGVIFNRIGSNRHLDLIAESVNKHCRAIILGYLPREENFSIPDRHLGLFMGDEHPLQQRQIEHLAECISENINLDLLVEKSKLINALPERTSQFKNSAIIYLKGQDADSAKPARLRIAVAQDKAFCFYYQDNLDILESLGAKLISFSPLQDERLPDDIDAIYLGGGYPELHARKLSENKSLLNDIKQKSSQGLPIYGECGGFMFLTEGIIDQDEVFWPMAGIFPLRVKMKKRLSRLGYREVICKSELFGQGNSLFGHEFHYSEIEDIPEGLTPMFTCTDHLIDGYQTDNTLASYLHVHFGRSLDAAENFINFCGKRSQN